MLCVVMNQTKKWLKLNKQTFLYIHGLFLVQMFKFWNNAFDLTTEPQEGIIKNK